jgi:dTDP-3-amino-2,3,6-trideoxy-4-keto-D-glucose/dTDP-3-amino-3,4,6-trideoxy-alpha-D-glucose/dTDP-2,6-dideoxy-D-kanosamine transaminase
MIPLNDTSRLSELIISNSLNSIIEIINSGRWLLGRYTEQFSKEFSEYIGCKYCLPVANGTDALEIALRTIGGELGGEVITVANAGGYTSTACKLVGLKPIYIDIDKDSLLIDISQLSEVLSKKTVAIVITHLYGRAVDVVKVKNELDKLGYFNVKIIEDCAQAHGAKINGRYVGSLGDISTFSFYPTKNLGAVGDAGAILTSDEGLYLSASKISQYGWNGKYNIEVSSSRNSRMDEIQAAILLGLLSHVDDWNKRRREIYYCYSKSENESLEFFNHLDESNVVHLAIVKVESREKFILHMKKHGVSVDVHYPILDTHQKAWSQTNESTLVNSESTLSKIVTLPCFPTMLDSEVELVCYALRSWKNV